MTTATMTGAPVKGLTALMRDYAACNEWANKQLIAWLRGKPAGLMDQPVPSSFPSLRETLVHIWDVERVWMALARELPPLPSFRQEGFDGGMEELFDGLAAHSEAFADYVRTLSEAELTARCHFVIRQIVEADLPRHELIQHAVNHSTYHRGQLVTIGRQLGLTDAPMTDYMFYLCRVKPGA